MKMNAIQQRAIETIDTNVALIAGAGTGKTRVLTHRFLHLLRHGHLQKGREIPSIVAITFTNKAADEMRSRIRKLLEDEGRTGELDALKWQLNQFRVSTIHTFCEQLLREYPVEAGVDPHFTILDDHESSTLFQSGLRTAFQDTVQQLGDEIPLRNEWFEHGSFFENVEKIYNQKRASGAGWRDLLRRKQPPKQPELEAVVLSQLLALKDNKRAKNFQRLSQDLGDWEITLQNGTDDEKREIYRKLCVPKALGTTDAMKELRIRMLPILASLENESDLDREFLVGFLRNADECYRIEKSRRSALDFDDLQEKALLLLNDPNCRTAIQENCSYLMIDECQDINDLQKQIFYQICSVDKPLDRQNLFIVGDPRQSIYGFRYADVRLFEEIENDIVRSGGVALSMQENYRCSEEIIGFVNQLSAYAFPKLDGLIAKGDSQGMAIEICRSLEETEGVEADAERVGEKILQLKEQGIEWGEISLLFRSATKIPIYEKALKVRKIPHISVNTAGFWTRQEVLDLYSLYAIVIDPADDISWLTFLHSPMAGIDPNRILHWARARGRWEEKLIAQKYQDENAERIIAKVSSWREELDERSPLTFLRWLAQESGLNHACARTSEAESTLSTLDNLYQWIADEERIGSITHHELLTSLRKRIHSERDNVEESDETEDRVMLSSIHKAKGTEKDVIFLVGIDAKSNARIDPFLYDSHLGLSIASHPVSAHYELAKLQKQESDLEEENRVLYVALTRAKRALYLTNQTGKVQNYAQTLAAAVSDLDCLPTTDLSHNYSFVEPENEASEVLYPLLNHFQTPGFIQRRTFSFTQLKEYLTCPRRWYYQYLLRFIPEWEVEMDERQIEKAAANETSLSAIQKGILFHALVEMDEPGLVIEQIEKTAGRWGMEMTEPEIQRMEKWVQTYRSGKPDGELSHEVSFLWDRADYQWTGSIDLIRWTEDEYEIYDFKTNYRDEHLLKEYSLQMQFYALACRALYGKLPRAAYLWWIPGDRLLPVDISDMCLDSVETTMDVFTSALETGKFDKGICDPQCKWNSICNLV